MNKLQARERRTRKIIEQIKQLDLKDVDIDSLRELLRPLLVGFRLSSPTWQDGTIFFRGRAMSVRPTNISELSYPPVPSVNCFQRANRPGKPMFYCSLTRDPVFFELRVNPGDMVAMSRWRTGKKMVTWSIGFTDESFCRLDSTRRVPEWAKLAGPLDSAFHFFADEFTRQVEPGDEMSYKISVALAENIFDLAWQRDPQAIADDVQNAGIHFPSVAMRANSDNLALHPAFVDSHLTSTFIEWIRIDEVLEGPVYRISRQDFSDSFSEDGTINWVGHAPRTVIHPGETILARVESGHLVFRDEGMNLVGYRVE